VRDQDENGNEFGLRCDETGGRYWSRIIANCSGDAGTRTPSPGPSPAKQWRGNSENAPFLEMRLPCNPSAMCSRDCESE
jgi:hypothetical protein